MGFFRAIFAVMLCATVGCVSFSHEIYTQAPSNDFQLVGVIDYREDSPEDFAAMAQPGDIVINTMRLGRAASKRQWLFALLPHGHAMVVLDPNAADGILECRFHGVRRVGSEELGLYSYNAIYRLRDPSLLEMDKLQEFAEISAERCGKYRFRSWIGWNGHCTPATPDEIASSYTCSTMVAAMYRYAGVELGVLDSPHRVVTPGSLIASHARCVGPLPDGPERRFELVDYPAPSLLEVAKPAEQTESVPGEQVAAESGPPIY